MAEFLRSAVDGLRVAEVAARLLKDDEETIAVPEDGGGACEEGSSIAWGSVVIPRSGTRCLPIGGRGGSRVPLVVVVVVVLLLVFSFEASVKKEEEEEETAAGAAARPAEAGDEDEEEAEEIGFRPSSLAIVNVAGFAVERPLNLPTSSRTRDMVVVCEVNRLFVVVARNQRRTRQTLSRLSDCQSPTI